MKLFGEKNSKMIALLIINDLNILSIKLGYSEIPLSIFEFFQFLMDILKI